MSAEPANSNEALLDRAGALLAEIWDVALVTLPGWEATDGQRPLELRLGHFKPDLSERVAALLEELGL